MNMIGKIGVPAPSRVRQVVAGNQPFVLAVKWTDGSKSRVDLTGLVHRSRHFNVFKRDPAAFRKVRVVNYGSGIGWANGLDYSAATLKTLADEQQPLGGSYLKRFSRQFDLNTAEIAALLQIAERTVRAYRLSSELPQSVAISLRRMEADPTVLAAHYRPVATRPRGRPKKLPSRRSTSG